MVHVKSSVADRCHKALKQAKAALPILHGVPRRSEEDVSKASLFHINFQQVILRRDVLQAQKSSP